MWTKPRLRLGLARATSNTLVGAHLAWRLDVALKHRADVRLALDVAHDNTTLAGSVLATGLTVVATGLAINLGTNGGRDRRQVGVAGGHHRTTWIAEKLRLGIVRRPGNVLAAVRDLNHATLRIEKVGRNRSHLVVLFDNIFLGQEYQ